MLRIFSVAISVSPHVCFSLDLILIFSFRVVLVRAYRGLTGGFLLLRNFSVAISVSPRVYFILVLKSDFNVSNIMHL